MNGEEAVRLYLMYLSDPNKLVDASQIKKLEAEADRAKDPVDKLRAIAALERARNVDEGYYREGFVRSARDWAEREGVPAAAFRAMGVPDDALEEAGFDTGRRTRRPRATARRSGATGGRMRARSVSADDIKAWILSQSSPFTTSDIQSNIGGSPGTIKKVLDDVIGAGQVERLGPVPDHVGRGRAPLLYETVG